MTHDPNRKPGLDGVQWLIVIPLALGLWAVILALVAIVRHG